MKRIIYAVIMVAMLASVSFGANYQESAVTGTTTSWLRCGSGGFYNPPAESGQVPSIYFNMDKKTVFPDGTIVVKEGVRKVSVDLSTPNEVFPMVNPMTGEVIPGAYMDYKTFFAGAYSLGLYANGKQDAVDAAKAAVPVEIPVAVPAAVQAQEGGQ